jgi:molybdate transport system ATP-binding protein
MLSLDVAHDQGAFRLDARFEAGPGITALFGPSGSGKTSIVNALAGLLRPGRGRIAIGGRVLVDTAAGVFVPPWRRRVGLVFQDARLFPHMNVAANLDYGRRWAPDPPGQAEIERIVDLLDLRHLLKRRPANLSGGERSRVALGRALLARPEALLMDEPLASLDSARKSEILPHVERLRDERGLVILYVTHAIEEVTRLADTLVLLDAGKVIASGPIEALTTRLDLVARFPADQAGAVLAGTVAAHHSADGLTEIDLDGARLLVPRTGDPVGARLRVRIAARDVSLARGEVARISVLNRIPARVRALLPHPSDDGMVDVALSAGDDLTLVARVTRRAVAELELSPGVEAIALVKSVALDRRA